MDFIKNQIKKVARFCFEEGLVNGSAGNISQRYKSDVYITTTGAFFGDLTDQDILKLNIKTSYHEKASSEYSAHRAIYLNTDKKAILHTHPKYSILVSFFYDMIIPIDSEGKTYFKNVDVLDVNPPSSSKELELALSEAFAKSNIVIVKTHGVFAAGNSLMEAYKYTGALEHSSFILLKAKNMLK